MAGRTGIIGNGKSSAGVRPTSFSMDVRMWRYLRENGLPIQYVCNVAILALLERPKEYARMRDRWKKFASDPKDKIRE